MSRTRDQYRTIAAGAGWIDDARRGQLRFDGRDAVTFLQALLTNDVASLEDGHARYAAYLTPQGRMITDLVVRHRGDHLIATVPRTIAAALAARFDLLIFTEDVRVADESDRLGQILVAGGDAPRVVASAVGEVSSRESGTAIDAARLAALTVPDHVAAGDVLIARSDRTELPTFEIIFPSASGRAIAAALSAAGAVEMDASLLTALRIDAGRPEFGVDMSDDTIPLEAGLLERAISQTKGCYVGQEVIVRVLHRGAGRVARRLVRLVFDADVLGAPREGAAIIAAGAGADPSSSRETGRVTSAGWSAVRDRAVALGYVHRDDASAGTRVSVDGQSATVDALATA
jgi:folate-binding protein YgfZ